MQQNVFSNKGINNSHGYHQSLMRVKRGKKLFKSFFFCLRVWDKLDCSVSDG